MILKFDSFNGIITLYYNNLLVKSTSKQTVL